MQITVGICTWNRADLLRQTLEAFETLAAPTEMAWELLVVDNNSTDTTQAVLQAFVGRLPLRPLFEAKQGQSAARNRIIAEAAGDLLVWTDDDVQPDPQWLPALCAAFDRDAADLVFGIIRPLWLAPEPTWFGPQFWGNFALLDYGPRPFTVTDESHQFYGANHAVRTVALRNLGGYREDLGLVGNAGGGDDTDLFLRARAAGLKMVYEPAAVVGHMIEPWRCTKRYHRRRTWRGCKSYFHALLTDVTDVPRILRIPRFLFRQALANLGTYIRSLISGDRSEAFYRELKLIQFAGLLNQAVRYRAPRVHDRGV